MDQIKTGSLREKLKAWHAKQAAKSPDSPESGRGWACFIKNPAFWVIAFYCIKGTAVTVVALGAMIWAL